MAPIAVDSQHPEPNAPSKIEPLKEKVAPFKLPPAGAQERYQGYPYNPPAPDFLHEAKAIRSELREYVDPATRADPEKKALFGAAKEVKHLGAHIGIEIVGLQLKELDDKQRDELALLVAERTVVFFRDQDLSPQKQREIGVHLGDGEIEIHRQASQVPGVGKVVHAILNHIYDVCERSLDIQVRWKWTPGTSAIWDNRTAIHSVAVDYERGVNNRHGTRDSSLGEKPYFDPNSKTRREALKLDA